MIGFLKGKGVGVINPCPVLHNLASDRTAEASAADRSFPRLHRCNVSRTFRHNLTSDVLTIYIPLLME